MQALKNTHRKSGKALIDSKRVPGKFYINCAYYNQPGAKALRCYSHAYTVCKYKPVDRLVTTYLPSLPSERFTK